MVHTFNFHILKGFATLALMLVSGWSLAYGARSYGAHDGYLSSIEGEREAHYKDLILIQPPQDDKGITLRERIFNDKLSKEFRDRYEEKFGRTEVQRVYNSPNRFTYYDDLYGFKGSAQDMNQERQSFAEYMLRRLAEFHVDNYMQNDPKARPIWEAKERISQMKLEVDRVRFDIKYFLAGNTLDINAVNPWFSTAVVRFQMLPGAIGPAPVEETVFSIGKDLTSSIAVESHYYLTDGVFTFISRKALTAQLSGAVTVSTFTKDDGKTVRESLYLSGLSYSF